MAYIVEVSLQKEYVVEVLIPHYTIEVEYHVCSKTEEIDIPDSLKPLVEFWLEHGAE